MKYAVIDTESSGLFDFSKPADAIGAYAEAVDDGAVVVAFNAQYDTKIMRGEMRRAGVDDRFERTPNICAMRALVDICQIPKKTGRGFKFPKLSEACAYFEIVNNAEHSAAGDADACVALLRKLRELGRLPVPAVYYAKAAPELPAEVAA